MRVSDKLKDRKKNVYFYKISEPQRVVSSSSVCTYRASFEPIRVQSDCGRKRYSKAVREVGGRYLVAIIITIIVIFLYLFLFFIIVVAILLLAVLTCRRRFFVFPFPNFFVYRLKQRPHHVRP